MLAISILSERPQDYAVRPFIISGTCKRESVAQHRDLLQTAVKAVDTVVVPRGLRLYFIGTDGDSRRRRALVGLALAFI